ncbi:hypothetical protein PUNSTDRAFT_51136 [Punctularia strigosozonata HHB-11173 SS5]|uniref:uncharacterized protein n=1 Tax=Punctularia strigosozonata (strain HHB-11173) TaxID=741275 RepID=UPI0004418537|nr:uncharacterized protein PUNSTDRAFT_51136 [Punctularia strigosozonata HHB-11173 SS5]EIN10514.1 hypothetical protein PUNSTDRAFT_51136 [Punctularia strigosozonata HHB-11173 SS5]
MEHWDLWYSYIHWRRDLQYSAPVTRQALSFLELVYDVIEVMGSPVTLLQQARSHWDKQTRDRACELLIQVFCQREMGEHALGVLDEMQDQGLDAPVRLKLRVVRALVKSGKFELANPLFSGMAAEGQRFRFYHSTGLSLFAHQGNASDAIRFYDHIHRFFGGVSNADKALLLHAHAVNGDTENVTRLFADLFQNSKSSAGSPTIYHYTAVILAHVQRGDFEGLNAWLERMSRAGIQPDVYVYTVILKSFANRKDVDSLAAVLDQMHEAGLPPNAVSYTTVVKTLADRKDPITAEAIYKRAISEGIVPDWRMIAALMNAHVEAGSWRGVIRAFDYLKQSPTSRISLNIDIYNTLLKAYVFIGAPYRVVSAIFHKLNEAGLRPDRYTFALLIQSACDANLMDIASSIFVEMDRLSEQWHSDLHINAYVMTIIMAGYLRRGDKLRAKAVYDDMRTRGIQPTSVTFGTILKAYGGEGTEESMKIAESFLSSLMAEGNDQSWMHIERSRAEALEDVYAPLMGSYRRRDSPADVERLFQRLLDAGGEPTLGTLTMLMDAYRRTRNLESVQQVWPQIFQMALRYSRVDALFPKNGSAGEVPRRQSNVLCVPLSIYIDALSMAGQHNEVAGVWHKLQVHGFSFDSHNWNHLVVALVRAGEPELAFEVVERVILPYQDQARQLAEQRNDKPDSPLFYDDAVDREETVLDLPSESPLRRSKRRREMVKRSTRKTRNLLDLSENEEQNFDYAHPLHILQQVSIQWNQWRPHGVTIGVLSNVLEHLESGSIVQPIRPPGEDPPPVTDSEQEPWSRAAIAREQLSRIYSDYPRTVMAIDEYLRAETRGLQKNRHKIS